MNEDKQSQNKKSHQDALKWIILGLLGFVVIVLIFGLGIWIGGAKARFSYRWAESYHKNFAGPRAGFLGDWRILPPPGDFIEGHGTFGEIIKIDDSSFVIKGHDDVEKVIVIRDETIIKRGIETVKKDELKVSEWVVIIGSPNEEGQIEAKLIRVFDKEVMKDLPKPSSRLPFFRFPFFKK